MHLLRFAIAISLVLASPRGADSYLKPEISVSPSTALLDQPVRILIRGLRANQHVTVRGIEQAQGRKLESNGEFVAGVDGAIDLSKQPPITGTYTNIDPMGLFWSMRLVEAGTNPSLFQVRREITFHLEEGGTALGTAKLVRLMADSNVRSLDVRENGLIAKLYEPESRGPNPGILVLGGSEGGIGSAEARAAILASHGYAALALAYFGIDNLPSHLAEIPLEYFKSAIDWLSHRENINPNALAVMGMSKGAELALLLATRLSELRAVVAYAPSSVAWAAVGKPGPSWTFKGEPVPFVPISPAAKPRFEDDGKTMVISPIYLESLQNREAVQQARIPVEKINGPVLLISGGDDQLWPSELMADMVMARLKETKFRQAYQHIAYKDAGHYIGIPYGPTGHTVRSGTMLLGGTPEANARAQADSWPKVLQFLQRSLRTHQ